MTNRKDSIVRRPWGSMVTFESKKKYWVKIIKVLPGRRLSLQDHQHRGETWVCIEGEVTATIGGKKHHLLPGKLVTFGARTRHRLSSKTGGAIIEVAYGTHVTEKDIVRYEDDFGRVNKK